MKVTSHNNQNGDGDASGGSVDLKMATIYEGASTVVAQKYYRYWEEDSGTGWN